MEPTKFRVKKVDATNPAVWARITAMDAACFADGSPALESNVGAWWIATAGEEEAGYCGVRHTASVGVGYLCRAGVLPKFRGAGLQKLFIRRRLAHAKAQGWTYVVTDTNDNPASANSLIACDFRLYRPESPWSFDTSLYWRKHLQ